MRLAVLGLGYVGLPLALEAVSAGHDVVGFDIDQDTVTSLNTGQSRVDDVDDRAVARMLEQGFRATTDAALLRDRDVYVMCVPTPLDSARSPDMRAIHDAAALIAAQLQRDTLVVLESTTHPGTTDGVVRPILETSGLEAGTDFALAYSPERIDPGNQDFGIRNTPKVVGGLTADCTNRAVAFYSTFVDQVIPTVGTREAEMSKLLENTYRHINIALVNEMAIFCKDLEIDLWAAIDAAKTKPFGFSAFYPGPGVGGHCIPIDPNYLSHAVRSLGYPFRFVELAQEISERMPLYVAARAQTLLNNVQKPVNGSRILLLGVTYKANISDERETPARPLARRLLDLGANLSYADPYVGSFLVDGRPVPRQEDLEQALRQTDLAILVQAHDEILKTAPFSNASLILDTRGVLSGPNIDRL